MKPKYFFVFIFFAALIYWILNPYYESKKINYSIDSSLIDSTISLKFSAVGDIMCHSTQYYYARLEKDSFDFKPVFSVVGDYLRERDILIGNLETVLAGNTKNYSGYPFFNSPNELANSLKYAGFNFLTTANNHANDMGYAGVTRTLDVLKDLGIVPLGTDSLNGTPKNNLFFFGGLKFGLLSYTYGTNYRDGAINPTRYVNYIDTLKVKEDIQNIKSLGADITILLYHFGEQYQKDISSYQKRIVERSIEYGADIILGSHPHIIQQFERFPTVNGKVDSGLVVYSLGNFVSNQRWRYSDGGVIFNFEITKNIFSDSVYISDISFLPIWVFKGKTNKGLEYIILPAKNDIEKEEYEFLTDADVDSIKRSFNDTVEQLTRESNLPKLVDWN